VSYLAIASYLASTLLYEVPAHLGVYHGSYMTNFWIASTVLL